MHYFLEIIKTVATYSNIILLVGFIFEKILIRREKYTNLASNISIFLAVVLSLYLISFVVLLLNSVILKNYIQSVIFIVFIIAPFFIGDISVYKKAGIYINMQIITLLISLLFLFYK